MPDFPLKKDVIRVLVCKCCDEQACFTEEDSLWYCSIDCKYTELLNRQEMEIREFSFIKAEEWMKTNSWEKEVFNKGVIQLKVCKGCSCTVICGDLGCCIIDCKYIDEEEGTHVEAWLYKFVRSRPYSAKNQLEDCSLCGARVKRFLLLDTMPAEQKFDGDACLLMRFPFSATTRDDGPRVLKLQILCPKCLSHLERWRGGMVRRRIKAQ